MNPFNLISLPLSLECFQFKHKFPGTAFFVSSLNTEITSSATEVKVHSSEDPESVIESYAFAVAGCRKLFTLPQ